MNIPLIKLIKYFNTIQGKSFDSFVIEKFAVSRIYPQLGASISGAVLVSVAFQYTITTNKYFNFLKHQIKLGASISDSGACVRLIKFKEYRIQQKTFSLLSKISNKTNNNSTCKIFFLNLQCE